MSGTKPRELEQIEKLFVAKFDGDVDSTAAKCGLTSREGNKLVRDPRIRDAIRDREKLENPARQKMDIADRADRQRFWSLLMNGEVPPKRDGTVMIGTVDLDLRVKASELLGKSEGDFVERREHSGKNGGPILSLTVHATESDVKDRIEAMKTRRALPLQVVEEEKKVPVFLE